MKPTIIRRTRADKLFDTLNVILMAIVLVITLYPLYFVLIASVSDAYEVAKGNVFLWPKGFTAESYLNVFKENRVWLGYRNTLVYTLTGTFFSLILTIPSAYALSKKSLPGRRLINVFFLIPMYFNGGLIPTYIVCKNLLGLSNNYAALIVPMLVSPFNIIIMRTFLQTTVPFELIEASTIDGAGEYTTLCRIVLPIMKPGIATVALLTALGYWNEWFLCMLYVTEKKLYPLQYLLMEMQKNSEFLARNSSMIGASGAEALKSLPSQTMRMAVVVFIVLPIACAYPFFQRYIVAGLTVGSVKG